MPRWGPLVLALMSSAFALLSLAPDTLSAASENVPWSGTSIQVQRDVLAETPLPIDFDLAVLSRKPREFSPQDFSRIPQAVSPSHFGSISTTFFVSPTGRCVPNVFWWKHRRYMCQILDTPPPPGLLRCTL